MKLKTTSILLLFFGIVLFPREIHSQETKTDSIENPMDGLGDVNDAFQESFFEGLKQKAIENYELALNALSRALKATQSEENKAAVHFEMGKNYMALKDYSEAENNFNQVLKSQGDRLDVMQRLYDLYYLQSDYDKSIALVKKLIPFDEDYKEDLANLYTRTKQYKEALEQLDELDEVWGESDIRNALRSEIYRATGDTKGAISNLEQKIDSNPKNEREYLNLIFLYSDQGNKEKAFETAKNLLKTNPNSELVHLALYKFYLDSGEYEESMKSMKIVFASDQMDKETKYRVLGDFIQFVNQNPQYEADLENVVSLFSEENGGKVYEKIGDYFVQKSKKEEALHYYEIGIGLTPDNYNLLKNTLLLQLDFKKNIEAANLSAKGLEIFPAQALLYLLNGVANNNLQKSDLALGSLENGLDFVLDDPQMERDFYHQLNLAYTAKGDSKKAKAFADKANQIPLSN